MLDLLTQSLCFQARCGGSRIYFYFLKIYLCILVLAAPALHCCASGSSLVAAIGATLRWRVRPSHRVAPLVAERRL